MKKFSLMALALGLFLAAGNAMAADAPAGLQDSTWLANDSVMSKTVGQPNSGQALGTIIIWPATSMPNDAANWRECNGQSLAGTEVCRRNGICAAPDYRGQFLRGAGANGVTVGAKQEAAIPQNMGKGSMSHQLTTSGSSASGSITGTYVGWAPLAWDNGLENIWSYQLDIVKGTNVQRSNELRPANIGVRHLIKVN